jgi:predicted ATPase
MNLLTKIRIQGFKSIVDQAFEPGQVNVLIGANGSGKTALLEALGMLSAAMNGRVDNSALQGRGVRLGTPQLYKSAFKGVEAQSIHLSFQWQDEQRNDNLEYSVTLANANQSPSAWYYQAENFRLNDKLIMQPRPSEERQASEVNNMTQKATVHLGIRHGIGFEAIYRRLENNRMQDFLEALKSYAIYSPTTPALRDLVTDITPLETDFPISFFGNRLAEAIEDIIDLDHEKYGHLDLDDVLDMLDWTDDIAAGSASAEILSPVVPRLQKVIRFTDRFMSENNNVLTAYDASEGSLYVLFLLTIAMHPQAPRLFAVENFDQALNPRLARATADLFCQAIFADPRQPTAFLSTHNPLVLDGIDIRDDRVRLFAIDRDPNGYTTINRVTITEELLEKGKQGLALSDLWVMGLLGGVPRL